MAKQSGLGDGLLVDGVDLSGDIGSISRINGGAPALDLTGIDVHAHERRGGVLSGGLEFQAWFNPDNAHPELGDLPRGNRIVTYLRGQAVGKPAASVVAKQLNYDGARNQDGSFPLTTVAESTDWGVDWGFSLTDWLVQHVAADEEAGVEDAGQASTAFGLQAFLHVVSFTGTDVTIAIQESNDDGVGDAYDNVANGVFAEVTAEAQAQRLQTARNAVIKQWLRVATTTTLGFTELTFWVGVTRNISVVNF